jgi:hypothetical protein
MAPDILLALTLIYAACQPPAHIVQQKLDQGMQLADVDDDGNIATASLHPP